MKVIIDARGIPKEKRLLLIERAIEKAEEGEIVVLAEDDNEKVDIAYAARDNGWVLKRIECQGKSYRITISKD